MYSGDTFFHLSLAGQIGLAIVSIVLAMLVIWIFLKISIRFSLAVKVLAAIILLWLFVWLSPQLYYFYYLLLFDDLPLQIVVQSPPTIPELLRLVSFTGNASLSDHSKGILFWLMVAIGLWQSYAKRP